MFIGAPQRTGPSAPRARVVAPIARRHLRPSPCREIHVDPSTSSLSAHPRTDYGRDNHKREFVLYARTGFTTALQSRAATQPGISPAHNSNNAAATGNADTFAEASHALTPLTHDHPSAAKVFDVECPPR